MSISESYNKWAKTYDEQDNKTRDLDGEVLRRMLDKIPFECVVELGCGTGKNTVWLAQKAKEVVAIDFSPEMLALARRKIKLQNVKFQLADITKQWPVYTGSTDLVTAHLVLEHIPDLKSVFGAAYDTLRKNGWLFISELHPFRQYLGSGAVIETPGSREKLETYTHDISEFLAVAKHAGFGLEELREWRADADSLKPPQLLSILFKK